MTITVEIEEQEEMGPAIIRLPRMSEDIFEAFCRHNPDLHIERNAQGEIELMPPSESVTDSRNTEITTDLSIWNRQLSTPGIVFGPSAGFTLPDGAQRAPDAAWISAERWSALSTEARSGFAHICPDFVVELMSPSDRLANTQRKMEEYITNGARLGWIIDRKNRQVHVYRPDQSPRILNDPAALEGDPELTGFTLPMQRIF